MNELLKDRKRTETDKAYFSRPAAEQPAAADAFDNRDTFDSRSERGDAYTRQTTGDGANTNMNYDQSTPDDRGSLQSNALFPANELHQFRSRWDQVQASFVDEPRVAVEQADILVAKVVDRITEQFASEREQLEGQWARGEDGNTENLRQTFKRYRAFFDRLLSFNGDEMTAAGKPATF
ncbi:MAG TPA: hypothetical protein VFB43_01715 [Terracidiphilus sp.]|nr:hypothetical protein [Terracidiphilus sp.]